MLESDASSSRVASMAVNELATVHVPGSIAPTPAKRRRSESQCECDLATTGDRSHIARIERDTQDAKRQRLDSQGDVAEEDLAIDFSSAAQTKPDEVPNNFEELNLDEVQPWDGVDPAYWDTQWMDDANS